VTPDFYDHVQRPVWPLPLLLGAALLSGVLWATAGDTRGVAPVCAAVIVTMVLAAWLFRRLRVRVSSERVLVSFGPGWPKRTLRAERIVSAERVRNRWWWGWGVRLTPTGWMFNISGLDAVLVLLDDGKRFRIGTDEPDALCEAIRGVSGGG